MALLFLFSRYSHDEYSRQVSTYGSDTMSGGEVGIPQNSPTNTPTDMYPPDEDNYPGTPQEEIYTHTTNRDHLIISPSHSPSHQEGHKKKHHTREVMSVSPIQRDEEQIKPEDLHHEYSKPVQYQSSRLYHQHHPENYSGSPQFSESPQYTSHSPQHIGMPQYTQHGVAHRESPQLSGYSQQYVQHSPPYTRQSPQYRESPYRDSPSQRESPYRSPTRDYPDSGSPDRPPRSQRPKSARPKTGRKKSARQRQRYYEQETSPPVQYDAATILSSGRYRILS